MICYRFASFATPLRTVPASQPARFNRGDEGDPTQYLSMHPLGPLAELMRNAELNFVCRDVPLRVENSQSMFTSRYGSGEDILVPA